MKKQETVKIYTEQEKADGATESEGRESESFPPPFFLPRDFSIIQEMKVHQLLGLARVNDSNRNSVKIEIL